VRRLRLSGDARHDLASQATFTDPRWTGDAHQDWRGVEAGAFEGTQHLGELWVASDERRAAATASARCSGATV